MTVWQERIKTLMDRVVSIVVLVLALPVIVLAAAWITVASPGPLLFCQQRVGRHGKPFLIYKFRTMHVAPAAHALGSVTIERDPRLFPGAVWLRRLKIDELPQLLNVLGGSMSLVGPRPTVEEDCRRMSPRQQRRATVKPGMTGMAQIRGGAALPWPQRIEWDLQYIDHYRLTLDLWILAATFVLVLTGQADSNPPQADEWSTTTSTADPGPKPILAPSRKAA